MVPLPKFLQKLLGFHAEHKQLKWFQLLSLIYVYIEKLLYTIVVLSVLSAAFMKLENRAPPM